jgi:hypothetical protein
MEASMITLLIALWMAGFALIVPAQAERAAVDVRGETLPVAQAQGSAVRVIPDNPKSAPTTGSGLDDTHGYVCRTLTLRRDDGGLTKVRRCAE